MRNVYSASHLHQIHHLSETSSSFLFFYQIHLVLETMLRRLEDCTKNDLSVEDIAKEEPRVEIVQLEIQSWKILQEKVPLQRISR